ncbi:hypothetical protein BG004_005257 [Podila humilis]|nr:hypothetical protein BG004_005257 [Podila humilis]
MAVHTRKESQGGLLETADEGDEEEPANPSTDRMERSASHQGLFGTRPMFIDSISAKSVVSVPALRAVPPSLEPIVPIACGCSRHYSHAILSTIVPLSVAACFEVLFSGIGTGSGDVLLKEAHRTKNGSTALKLSDWRHADTSAPDSCHFWENKKRQLEYSVSLKIPLLTKTSTTCSETLDIVHFSDDVILVHSETKTPNVPYAEHFSTVSQMCLTWDSHGNTRVKCFAEINFSKKLVFGNKIEVSLLESSSEYYRELVSRLVDYAEHLELGPVIRAIGSGASAHTSHKTTLSNGQTTIVCSLPSPKPETMPALVFKVDSEENAKPDFRHASISSSANATEMSPAFSLLSQQHLRHPPSQKTGGRVSMDNLRSSSASLLPVPDKTKRAATVDKKSALSFIQNILKPTSIPDVTPSTIKSNESTAHKADNVDVPSKTEDPEKAGKVDKDSAVVALWSDIKRFSVALFTKDTVSKDKDKAALAILATERKASALAQPGASETPLPTPITSGAPNSQSEPNSDAVGYTIAPNMPAKHTAQLPAAAALKRPAYQWLSLRAIVGLFMVVMAISVMNMWYLFGVVSSVVQVVQEKHDYTSFSGPFASIPLKTKTPSSFTSRPQPSLHVHSSESLAPIQTQTDVLRAEIRELLGLLELARREIHQSDN